MKLAVAALAIVFASCSFTRPAPEPPDFVYIRESQHEGWVEVRSDFMIQALDKLEECMQRSGEAPSGTRRLAW